MNASGKDPAAPKERRAAALTDDEWARYARQIVVPEIGREGQARLKNASALVVGAGGLGCPAALYLAASGIGRLGIIDPDTVEASNLQRQILHFTSDIGKAKVESARVKLIDVNPFLEIDAFTEPLKAANALRIVKDYDVVIDGSDNFPTRYVINDSCVLLKKPMIYGSVQHFFGQVSVFDSRNGPCFRCVMPDPPLPGSAPGCAEQGVLGVVPGIIGTLQAVEAIKIILRLGTSLIGRLLLFEAFETSFDVIEVAKNPDCPVCGAWPTITAPVDEEEGCHSASPESQPTASAQNRPPAKGLTVSELKKRIQASEKLTFLDLREPGETDEPTFKEALRIPMSQVMDRTSEIPRDREVIVLCRIGIQSQEVIRRLQGLGFTSLLNLEGGTIAWRYDTEIVPS